VAYDAAGERVGFIIPSRSAYDASVSYLGVVPEFRGQGYVDDLLAEITHVHADAGARRITGTTDTTNAPMAAAFLRGGYTIAATRIVIGALSV
jgi:ribosomal protein S18 acetylase RimI-like enzyme